MNKNNFVMAGVGHRSKISNIAKLCNCVISIEKHFYKTT